MTVRPSGRRNRDRRLWGSQPWGPVLRTSRAGGELIRAGSGGDARAFDGQRDVAMGFTGTRWRAPYSGLRRGGAVHQLAEHRAQPGKGVPEAEAQPVHERGLALQGDREALELGDEHVIEGALDREQEDVPAPPAREERDLPDGPRERPLGPALHGKI